VRVCVEESAVLQVQGGSEAAVRVDRGSGECVLTLDGSIASRQLPYLLLVVLYSLRFDTSAVLYSDVVRCGVLFLDGFIKFMCRASSAAVAIVFSLFCLYRARSLQSCIRIRIAGLKIFTCLDSLPPSVGTSTIR
jgi:hypothetical protein